MITGIFSTGLKLKNIGILEGNGSLQKELSQERTFLVRD